MATNEVHHFEDSTANINTNKWASMWFFDTTLDQFGGYKADGTTLRYMFTTDSVRVPTTNLAQLVLDDGGFVGLGGAKGRIKFNDLATDTINFLGADVGVGQSLPIHKLDILGDGGTDEGVLRVNNNADTGARLLLRNNQVTCYFSASGTTPDTIATGILTKSLAIGINAARAVQFFNGGTASVKLTILEDGNIGAGTEAPLSNVGTAAGDFSGTGFHVKGSGATHLIVEGDVPDVMLADTAGAANEKIGGFEVDTDRIRFKSLNDDLTTRTGNILDLDMGTGDATFFNDVAVQNNISFQDENTNKSGTVAKAVSDTAKTTIHTLTTGEAGYVEVISNDASGTPGTAYHYSKTFFKWDSVTPVILADINLPGGANTDGDHLVTITGNTIQVERVNAGTGTISMTSRFHFFNHV